MYLDQLYIAGSWLELSIVVAMKKSCNFWLVGLWAPLKIIIHFAFLDARPHFCRVLQSSKRFAASLSLCLLFSSVALRKSNEPVLTKLLFVNSADDKSLEKW
jgi:hypothetical protein